MKGKVVIGVSLGWVVIGAVIASQAALGSNLQGNPIPLTSALQNQMVSSLPWIPTTLIAIALAARFPLTRKRWRRHVWIHLAAVPVAGWIANVGVVLGFWVVNQNIQGPSALVRTAAFWAVLRIHVAATVYGLAAAGTQAWLALSRARERELSLARLEAQLAEARFRALNEQIRPHFLFNTLHTIGQMWRSGQAEAADEMLDHLGSLFQRVRASTERGGIPLSEEMSMVRDYLAIEQARFSDRLLTEVQVDSEAERFAVPPLLLQPLVENAIRHGVSAMPGCGTVRVTATADSGRLYLAVEDDGPGLRHPTDTPGTGTGLSNTRERLAHAFGGEHSMSVRSREGGGTTVRIEMPAVQELDTLANGRPGGG